MMKNCVVKDGVIINIGDWDYQYTEVDGQQVEHNPLPAGAVIEEREVIQNADGGFVALESGKSALDFVKAVKIAELNQACNQFILSGLTSSAIGSPHVYDFDYEAQINLAGMMGCVNAGLAPQSIAWKTDQGVIDHSTAQFTQLYMDGLLFKQQQIDRYWTLKSQVLSAASEIEVNAIVW